MSRNRRYQPIVQRFAILPHRFLLIGIDSTKCGETEIPAHNKYDDLQHLRANIEEFIEEYYNRQRLHSALGYRPPEEFEQQAESKAESLSATMVFFENQDENRQPQSTASLGERATPPPPPDPPAR